MNRIDHIVINTRDRMEQAQACFKAMGFTVTPRGYHTMGSINYTIVFKTDYIELLGYPDGKAPEKLPELIQHGIGLLATVIKTDDADQTRAKLISRGFAPRTVSHFSRPVELENSKKMDAEFRVTMLEPDAIPGTWPFYCQHLTPELVWRSAWQTHPNGCVAMTRLIIHVKDSKMVAQQYLRVIDMATVEDSETKRCIIHLPSFEIILIESENQALGMQTLVFVTESLNKVKTALVNSGIAHHINDGRIFADTLSCLGCKIEFESIE